jgi:hypothetical protein
MGSVSLVKIRQWVLILSLDKQIREIGYISITLIFGMVVLSAFQIFQGRGPTIRTPDRSQCAIKSK